MFRRLAFQFSLSSLLTATAAISFVLSFFSQDLILGCIISLAAFEILVIRICISHHNYGLAYFVAAFVSGQLLHLMAHLPFSAIAIFGSLPVCLATNIYSGITGVAVATVIRFRYRGEACQLLEQALQMCYLSPAFFLLVANAGDAIGIPGIEPLALTFLSFVSLCYVITISIYAVLPAWLLVAALLDSIDDLEYDWIRGQ